MTPSPQNSSPRDRIGGGGAATSAGIRFQQQLGALISSWILAGDRFDESFRLGATAPEWVRFETEAPVDDLLIKTSDGGYVAVQAKTTASLSEDLGSPLGKTITQFVRHWYVANQGDGSMEWNRPLDCSRDRLVLAVSPNASVQVRKDLPAALLLVSQPGGGVLNQSQHHAHRVFSSLVERAWASFTKSPIDDRLLPELVRLVVVFTFDDNQADILASSSLAKAFSPDVDAAVVFLALSDLSGRLMRDRGGGDLYTWRQLLAGRGIALGAPPGFRTDIEALKRHSNRIADALGSYEKIEVASGAPLTVRRDCQAAVEAAVRSGPLLIIGEPGAGKSGVLNALARTLRDADSDVVELAVDRYSVETLEGLSRELGLKHSLLDVLEAWDGPAPAYLVIDALDATRGGRGEGVFRTLIERVLQLKGRWNVVASIRSFDLRMGQQFRTLFRGLPPDASLMDPSFAGVQHIQVPPWSEAEFDQLLHQSPTLAGCLTLASPRLRDLAMVPFNTRLLSELVSGGAVRDVDQISSQVDLLRLYWDHRVGGHGLPAMTSLRRVVQLMVQARALRAPALQAAGDDPAMIDTLCKDGVLVIVDNGRWVQFRHHLLFDYAAARVALEPSDIVSGTYRFRKAASLGLMLSPALSFVLREIWESETNRARFWIALSALINDEDGDPIIRSTAGRLGAEFPTVAGDCLWLGDRAISGDVMASKTLSHVSGALVVQIEDAKQVALEPWVYLAARLAKAPTGVAGTLRYLLHILIKRVKDGALIPLLGQAARALFVYGVAQQQAGLIVRSAIDFVIDTYETDIEASRALLTKLFDRDRLDRFGYEEAPAVCSKIAAIGGVDPEFVTDIYRAVFDYEVTEDRQTQIGQSQILNLRSNARQDYGMARWSLGEYLPQFLQAHPRAAVEALVSAVESYVSREHAVSDEALNVVLRVGGRLIRLREDLSYVWAHDPDNQHGQDAESLISKLRARLIDAPEPEAVTLLRVLLDKASLAVFWSRMFLCAVERGDSLVDELWPIAATEPFLVLPDTRKDAIDVVANGIGRRHTDERRALEQNALAFDFSRFQHRAEARKAFLERLFTAIGTDKLVTDEARQILEAKPLIKTAPNERLFAIHSHAGDTRDFDWIEGLDHKAPGNSQVINAVNAAKQLLPLAPNSEDVAGASLAKSVATLNAIRALLLADVPHAGLRRYAEAIIAQGCQVIVSRKLLVSKEAPPTPEELSTFTALLDLAARSESPESDDATEARFEESASWGSPAARIEAAQAYWDLIAQRPDLYPTLIPNAALLLADSHPAVRLNASVRLGRIWDIDRDRFWQLLTDRLARDPNLTVIEHVLGGLVSRLIHTDLPQTLKLLLALLHREAPGSARDRRLRKAIADKLSVLWVTYQSREAKVVLDEWLNAPWDHSEEARAILATLRGALVTGIGENPDTSAGLRQRSRALVADIVDAANTRLALHMTTPGSEHLASEEVEACVLLIDFAGSQMFFATDGAGGQREGSPVLGQTGLKVFLLENADLLKRIGEFATPHTTYYLLQLVERLVAVDAATAFDIAATCLQSGGRSGYQNESLGMDLLVRLIGVFLADHKEIFEDQARRAALVDCLEIFLDAGWPAARRLLYRLPELIQ